MYQTIAELASGLAIKKFSSVELTQDYLAKIKNSKHNAFISVCERQALKQAQYADKQIALNSAQTLTGIPYAHKDIFCTKGVKTSAGSKMLDNFISPYDATVSTKLNQAGAVMLGKANMDEFAMGSSNETSYYGAVKNPWGNGNQVPGGSSGGSAASVAGGLAPFATGTDTGGSIRQPASFCGISGIKPTYGRVSRYGMVAFASSLDQAGPLAITAQDCALILNIIAGFDANDSTSAKQEVEDYTKYLNKALTGLKIGLPKQFFDANLDSKIAIIVQNAIQEFVKMGAKLVDIDLPHLRYSVPTYYIVAPSECSSNLSRFDGVRYGYRCQNPKDLDDLYTRSRSEAFGDEVKRRIMIGTYTLSSGYYDAYYLKAQKMRRLIAADFKSAFASVDVIMGPTSPSTAFDIGSVKDPLTMYLSDTYTIAANLAGLPAMSIPAGFIDNMPVGVHLIANYWQEEKLLNIAHQFQAQTNYHRQIPTGF